MRWALEDAHLNPEDIDYINAHGTSTKANDSMETLAIKHVFGETAYNIPISSTKSMLGHALAGSGAIEAIACALSIFDKVMHPTINYETPDPECDLDYLSEGARPAGEAPAAITNSFAFGGTNAVLAVRRAG